jgi:hypothetical protein
LKHSKTSVNKFHRMVYCLQKSICLKMDMLSNFFCLVFLNTTRSPVY